MTISKKLIVSASALALSAIGPALSPAAAQSGYEDTGPYIGGGYTFLDLETDEDVGDNTNAVTGRFGWQFTPNLAVEAEGTFGVDDGEFDYEGDEDDFDFDENEDGDFNDALNAPGELGLDYMASVFGRYSYPVTDRVDLFARAGYSFVEIDSTIQLDEDTSVNIGGSESGPAFGAGAAFDITESSSIRADYTRYQLDDANADAGTISYEYKF